jgi:hypothetical protein
MTKREGYPDGVLTRWGSEGNYADETPGMPGSYGVLTRSGSEGNYSS